MIQNIILQKDKEALKSGYKRRVLVVSSFAVFFSFLIAAVLLIPPYILVKAKIGEISARQRMNGSVVEAEADILSFPAVTNTKSKAVLSFKNVRSVSAKLIKIVNSEPSGVEISGISYKETQGGLAVSVSGIALTRQALLSFEEKIKNIDFVKSASVPVSNFTKESNLPFNMSIVVSNTTQ